MQREQFLRQHFEEEDSEVPDGTLTKHAKMAGSPFLFYRGSAPLYYADIQQSVISVDDSINSLPLVYVMGDCHTSNFGFFSEEGSHTTSVIFAPNDFDDACVGHSWWDLVRYCTSLYLCRYHCLIVQKQGHKKTVIEEEAVSGAIQAFLDAYSGCVATARKDQSVLNNAIQDIDSQQKLHRLMLKARSRATNGETFAQKSALARATQFTKQGQLTFIDDETKFIRLDGGDSTSTDHRKGRRYRAVERAFAPYMDDYVHDIVLRIGAGTGSVNLDRYYLLVGPHQDAYRRDLSRYHIVEVKQQRVAPAVRYQLCEHPVNRLNAAHLTARCQKHMQRDADLILDEAVWRRKHWLVRSRHHAKVGIAPEDIAMGKKNIAQNGLQYYAAQCGYALALAHCRSDRRGNGYEIEFTAIADRVKASVSAMAYEYAQRVIDDHVLFCKMIKEDSD